MKISTAFPGKYVKAADLDGKPLPLTIKDVGKEWVGQGPDAEEKIVVRFKERDQGFVLNKTNSGVIAQLHGDDTDEWIGKRVTLYATTCQMGSKMVDCVRVRSANASTVDAEAEELF